MVRTIEDILGIEHLNSYDANALAMSDVFTETPDITPYKAILPGVLCGNQGGNTAATLGITQACQDSNVPKTASVPSLQNALHGGAWWAKKTKGFNFTAEDKVDADEFNRILWAGIKGDQSPYPTARSHKDLRQNRAQLLKGLRISQAR